YRLIGALREGLYFEKCYNRIVRKPTLTNVTTVTFLAASLLSPPLTHADDPPVEMGEMVSFIESINSSTDPLLSTQDQGNACQIDANQAAHRARVDATRRLGRTIAQNCAAQTPVGVVREVHYQFQSLCKKRRGLRPAEYNISNVHYRTWRTSE